MYGVSGEGSYIARSRKRSIEHFTRVTGFRLSSAVTPKWKMGKLLGEIPSSVTQYCNLPEVWDHTRVWRLDKKYILTTEPYSQERADKCFRGALRKLGPRNVILIRPYKGFHYPRLVSSGDMGTVLVIVGADEEGFSDLVNVKKQLARDPLPDWVFLPDASSLAY